MDDLDGTIIFGNIHIIIYRSQMISVWISHNLSFRPNTCTTRSSVSAKVSWLTVFLGFELGVLWDAARPCWWASRKKLPNSYMQQLTTTIRRKWLSPKTLRISGSSTGLLVFECCPCYWLEGLLVADKYLEMVSLDSLLLNHMTIPHTSTNLILISILNAVDAFFMTF